MRRQLRSRRTPSFPHSYRYRLDYRCTPPCLVNFLNVVDMGSRYVPRLSSNSCVQVILLPWLPKCWDYRHEPLHLVLKHFRNTEPKTLCFDDQDDLNQNYLADEEEEAEEEAQVILVPKSEEEEEEKEKEEEEEEKKEEEEGQGQPTGNAWWQKLQIMSEYLWDPERRMFLARTGLILLIYFFFYASLAAVITLCMYTLFLTISPYIPTFTERVKPPGVMIRPFAHSLNFNFNVSEPDTWQHYVISLNGFLQGYNDSLQEEMNVDCPPGQYFIQDGDEDEDKKACQFKRSFLKNCSGLEDPTFGYSTGQPCILLKMNRIVGFRPELGDPVKVSCKVQRGDENDIRSISYYPESASFDLRYYPYYGKLTHVNYTSPLVAMHFTDVVKNQAVPVQCQLKGKGIINDVINDRFVGRAEKTTWKKIPTSEFFLGYLFDSSMMFSETIRVAGTTGAHHHAQLIFVFLVETGFHHVGQAGFELLTFSDPPASASQSAEIT
ncbi:Protein ATP1B4, partial [Plecturocebus cupreus]